MPLKQWTPLIRRALDEYAEQAKTPTGAPPSRAPALPTVPAVPAAVEPPRSLPSETSGVEPFAILPRPELPEPPTDAPANRPDGTTGARHALPDVTQQDMRLPPPVTPARLPEPRQTPDGPKVLPPTPAPPPAPGGALIPLPPPGLPEPLREAWIQARTRAGDYCRGLGDVIRQWPNDVEREAWSGENIAEEVNAELRRQKRDIIKVATAEAVAKVWTPERLASELGHKTGEWSRNWLRVARTELQGANNEGVAIEAMRAFGSEARVARVPEAGACEDCIRLFTKDGRPIVFPVTELLANGTNVGRKKADWRAGLWPAHPQCATPGTLITTSTGKVRIEEVRVGDVVLAHDSTWRAVTATMVTPHDGPVHTIETDTCRVTLTGNHPVYTATDWVNAEDVHALPTGDCLWKLTPDEMTPEYVVGVEVTHYTGPVYNFEVEGAESYVANGLIVHNCRCGTISVPPGTTVTHDGTLVASR